LTGAWQRKSRAALAREPGKKDLHMTVLVERELLRNGSEPLRSLAWWAAEAERNGTDWRSLLLTVLRVSKIIELCPICEREPCLTPSFCQLCREADSNRARLPRNKIARQRPTPQTTIEAIKQAVRDRGVSALDEPPTRERLQRCDAAAIAEIDRWLLKRGVS
jgi:hypothetical protein